MLKRIIIFCFALMLDISLIKYGWQHQQFSFVTQIQNQLDETQVPLPCTMAIRYKIVEIDPKFKISQEELIRDASAAAQIWNKVEGKNLFMYDPEGELAINLIYDGRQLLSSQISNLQNTLDTEKKSLGPQEIKYKQDVNAYEQKSAQLKTQIDSWNEKGGAPQEIADSLNDQVRDLQSEAARLNQQAEQLNKLSQNFNTQVGSLNKTVSTFNSQLSEKPEEGVYFGGENRIEVYFNNGKQELIHTLAHEMGHALGMNHVESKKSIMYDSTNNQITPSQDDLTELKKICAIEPSLTN